MQQNANLNVTAKTIIMMLSRVHKHKVDEYNTSDFIEWCAECEVDYLGDVEGFELKKAEQLEVDSTEKRALLPCHMYRLLDVCTNEDMTQEYREAHYNNGSYLILDDDFSGEYIYINYYRVALDDDTGYPLIKRGHEQACEAFCLTKMYYPDFISGRMAAYVYNEMKDNLDNQLKSAKGSYRHFSRNDLEDVSRIVGNIVNYIGKVPTFQIDK